MHTDYFVRNLEKRAKGGIPVSARPPATDAEIAAASQRLAVEFPEHVVWFYRACNGLICNDPPLDVLPVESLSKDSNGLIHLATLDNQHRLCLDSTSLNAAGQWNIVEPISGCVVTLSMGAFWASWIFRWLDRREEIWTPLDSFAEDCPSRA